MKPFDPTKRYCGPGKGVIAWLVPEKPLGVCINRCCYKHDEAYEYGGTGGDRLRADEVFRMSIRITLASHWWIPLFVASWIAQRYFKAVRILGSARFNYRAVPDKRLVTFVKRARVFTRLGGNPITLTRYEEALLAAEAALAEAGETGE